MNTFIPTMARIVHSYFFHFFIFLIILFILGEFDIYINNLRIEQDRPERQN